MNATNIEVHERLSLETHVFPVLQENGFRPRWGTLIFIEDRGRIYCKDGCVTVDRHHNELHVYGKPELAKFLARNVRLKYAPVKEITVNFYPQNYKERKEPWYKRLFSLENDK